MVDFRDGRHGAFPAAAASALFNGHRWRHAVNPVDIRPGRGLNELPCIGVERFQIAALALGEKDIEGQRAFAAAADPRNHRERVPRNDGVDVAQIMFPRFADNNTATAYIGNSRRLRGRHQRNYFIVGSGDNGAIGTKSAAGMALFTTHDCIERAFADHLAARLPPFRSKVDDPIRGADDVEVMFDDDH